MFERILVPLDGSELAEQALPYAEEMAAKFNAQVILLRATTAETEALRETLDQTTAGAPQLSIDVARNLAESEADAARAQLERVAARFAGNGIKVETKAVEGRAERAILTESREANISLIVMATHGRGGLGRLVFGSVADAVLHDSKVPVMLIRAKGDDS